MIPTCKNKWDRFKRATLGLRVQLLALLYKQPARDVFIANKKSFEFVKIYQMK